MRGRERLRPAPCSSRWAVDRARIRDRGLGIHLLIVEDDEALLRVLASNARLHGYTPVTATNLGDACAAVETFAVSVALVDLALGGESGFGVIRHIKERTRDAEIVVMSATTSVASAIQSYELSAFAFVPKPFDLDHLFATVARALEHRRMNVDNRRLVWELQLINELGEDLRRSLDPRELLERALRRLISALDGCSGSVRLQNPVTKLFTDLIEVAPPEMDALWAGPKAAIGRPSDRVLVTRAPVLIPDLQALLPPELAHTIPVRGVLAVPMLLGDELIGSIAIGSGQPDRFDARDEQLLSIVAGQIASAVQNARLHFYARLGKVQWEATFDAISDPIAVYDADGRILRGNAALSAELQIPITDMRGRSCDDVGLCGGRFPDCAVGRAVSHQGSRAEVSTADARIFSVTTFPITDTREGAAVVQVAKNVTEEIASARRLRQMSEELSAANTRLVATVERLKTAQAQLLQAEKLSAIGQLVAGVAHELNNPLTSVIGYAQLVEEELLTRPSAENLATPQIAADVRRIAEESERAARIVRNLLAFARRHTAARSPQDLADLFTRVLALRNYEFRLNGIDVEMSFQPGLPRVLADAGQLQQALLNLVLNAERAMRGRPLRRLRVGAMYAGEPGAVQISVSDTGHGIEEGNLGRIFDPFFTTRDVGEGTGLGLSICYGILRDHGGQVTVGSEVGAGTTFVLMLPAYTPDAPGGEILVAHTDPAERDYVAAMLAGWGYRVSFADGAAAALARYCAGDIAALFVDGGTIAAEADGWRAACAARDTPIVLTSGAAQGDVATFGRAHAAAILTPPIELRTVRSAVQAVMGRVAAAKGSGDRTSTEAIQA